MVNKYFYEILRVWYLGSWKEICRECGKSSVLPSCPFCGEPKEYIEQEVTDKPTVRILEAFDRKKTEALEVKLNESSKEDL